MAIYAPAGQDNGFNPYAAGNKVYNGGSPQPTSGAVDPTGYVQRSINQSRSGLAKAAIQRLQAQTSAPVPGAVNATAGANPAITLNGTPIVSPTPIDTNGPVLHSGPIISPTPISPTATNGPVLQSGPIIGPTPISPTSTTSTIPTTPTSNSGTGNVLSPIVKPLQINDLGQINLPSAQTLSLDADLVGQVAAGTNSAQQQLQALQQQQQQVSQQYATDARNQVNAEPDILNRLLSGFAGRGMAFSSGYGQGVNNEQDRYMQGLDQLFSNDQNSLNGIVQKANQVPTTLQSLIAQLQGQQATRNITNAGTLNLNNQLAQLLNPNANKQFVVVNNDVDKAMALQAGYDPSQIVNAPGSTATGLGSIPQGAQNLIFAGKAGYNPTQGAQTAIGADRNATEQLLAQLKAGA